MSDPRCQRIHRSPSRLVCAGASTTVIARVVEIDAEDAAVVGGIGDAVAAGARLEQSGAASCATISSVRPFFATR